MPNWQKNNKPEKKLPFHNKVASFFSVHFLLKQEIETPDKQNHKQNFL